MARACRLDGGSCSITTWRPRQNPPAMCDVSRAIRRRELRVSGHRDPRRCVAADPPGRPPGAARRPTARASRPCCGCSRATCSPTRATCACWGARRVAYLRQSQELSGAGTLLDALLEPFADLQRLHDAADRASRPQPARRAIPATLARYGELQERYQHAGRLRAGGARQAADDGRRLRRGGPGALGRHAVGRRARPAGAGEGAGAEAGPAAARRADQPPRSRGHRAAGELPRPNTPGAFVLVSHDRAFIRAVCREIVELESRQVRPLPVRLRQVRRRARRAAGTRARRVRAAEGARRQDRGLHPPQPRRAEDQAGAEPAQDARQAGAAGAPRGRMATRGEDRRCRSRPAAISGGKETIRAPRLTRRLSGRAADPARRHRQHLPRRQGRHRRAERQRQVDAAQDAARRAGAASPARSRPAPACASATSIRSWGRWTRIAVADGRDPLGARRSVTRGRCGSTWRSFASSATTRSARCAACRAASAAGWRWRRSCCSRATCWCSTSRPTTSTSRRARRWRTRSSELRGHADRRQPRSLLPRPRLHAPAGDRRRPAGGAPRQLQRLAPPRCQRSASARANRRPPGRRRRSRRRKPASASAAARDADKDRERERRRLARRVETLEADVSKLEAELAAVRRSLPQITAATGRSCTRWPIGNASSTRCSRSGWPSGKPPARRCSTNPRHPPIDRLVNPVAAGDFGVARAPVGPYFDRVNSMDVAPGGFVRMRFASSLLQFAVSRWRHSVAPRDAPPAEPTPAHAASAASGPEISGVWDAVTSRDHRRRRRRR